MKMQEREVYISPMIQKMMEADWHFKKIVIMSICRFVSRVSFGSISAVQRHINEELIQLNQNGNWDMPHRISSPRDLIVGFYTDCIFDGGPSIWIMEETKERSAHPQITVLTDVEYLHWYIPYSAKFSKTHKIA